MLTLRLYLENIAGDWFGWIEDFPGAFSRGTTPQEVERAAPGAAANFLYWLGTHNEPLPDELKSRTSADFTVSVEQTITCLTAAPWEARHTMPQDAHSLQEHELDYYMRLLQCSRANLIDASAIIPPHEWDTAPLGGRSVRSFLHYAAEAEAAMLGRIGINTTFRAHPDPLTTLKSLRSIFEASVHEAFSQSHGRTIPSTRADWSLRKLLRLALWHERHCAEKIAVRSNPTAYIRSVMNAEAVVQNRDFMDRFESPVSSTDDKDKRTRHTHASAYYY